jgi:diguanylate cyclase (GGDEF)-like protein
MAVVLALGTGFVAAHDWLDMGGDALDSAAELVYDAVIIAAGVTCVARSLAGGRERWAWLAIGLAILAWGAAEVYWTAVIINDPSPPYPSPADIGYLAYYPLAGLGLALLVRARAHALDWRLWMDGTIACLGTAALGAAFVFDFVAEQTSGSALQVATTLAYPLGDIVMLSLVVGIIALTRWRPGRAWLLLLAGFAAIAAADVAYTLQSTSLGLPGGAWVEPIYLIGAVCLGAQAWQARTDSIEAQEAAHGWRELMVPAVFASVMIGLFGMQYVSSTGGLSTALWAATMIAVIVRLAISDRENRTLLAKVRRDELTGLGNRGGLQVDLRARCANAAEGPFSLLLFDLNGFKRYNDTFGHPAGDQLLSDLGERLRGVLADNGLGYRIGGDEFCVILGSDAGRFDTVLKEAAAALTWSERGIEVSASWGAVRVPEEAGSPREAMQLADLRMYAQKESRRIARDRAPGPIEAQAEQPRLGDRPVQA